MRKKIKSWIITWMLVLVILVGLSVMLYPVISDWWNQNLASHTISTYNDTLQGMDTETTEHLLSEAYSYNRKLLTLSSPFIDYKDVEGYDEILNVSNIGILGYITIPAIDVELPIYHGTSAEVLNIAAGHLQGSSLPVGGENTHAVISAHRGLPSARLFTDLDQLAVGDTFTITVLDQVLTYEVEKILIVKPEEVDKLAIIPEGDYVTLMTCTPYGVNTHRLLIRSHRIDTEEEAAKVKVFADASKLDPMVTIPFIAAPLFLALIVIWMIGGRLEGKRKHINQTNYWNYISPKKEGD